MKHIKAGQICSLHVNLGKYASAWLKNGEIREGMVLLDSHLKPQATYTFRADIWTIDGSTKVIKTSYQPVVHSSHIRQCCAVVLDNCKTGLGGKPDRIKLGPPSIDEHNKSTPTTTSEDELLRGKPRSGDVKLGGI